MVLDQPFPPDARVEREAMALAQAGYEVHLLCAARDSDLLREEYYQGFYIHRVDPSAVSAGLLGRLPYTGLIRNCFREFKNIDTPWHTLIERFVKSYRIEVLHIHDLKLGPTGLDIARRLRIPMVADLHENYPALMEMMKGKHDARRGKQQRRKWDDIEDAVVAGASRVITVADEAKDRLMIKGCPGAKITVLPNTVDIDKFSQAVIDPEVSRKFKANFLLTYVGHLNYAHRGIQTVLHAMAILRDEIPELAFVGAGGVREHYMAELAPLIEDAGLKDRVHFTGWLDETEFISYIDAADICLCPHLMSDQTNATFPNKVYLYHLCKKPIIVSNAIPLHRYVDETRGGAVFESGNAQDLAEAIRVLYRNAPLRRELATNGQQAVLAKHNWRETSRQLVELYSGLTAGLRSPQQ